MKGNFKSLPSDKAVLILLGCLIFLTIPPASHSWPSSSDTSIEDATLVERLKVKVKISGTVEFEGDATKLEMNLSIPSNHLWQRVTSFDPKCKLVHDAEGNVICNIVENDPASPYTYSLEFEVEVNRFEVESGELRVKYPQDVERYLRPTENIQSDDELIKELAERLVENATNDFEKVAKLARWVHDNIQYDESYANQNMDALWVLNHKRGVCAEYTTLFIALARAVGIPARYVHVYAYGKNGWESHATAEVYLGRWLPVDALWMEVGWVDATHVFFGSYADNQISSNIRLEGYNVRNVVWGKDRVDFQIWGLEERKSDDTINLFVPNSALDFGSKFVVVAEISPKSYGVDLLKLMPCRGIEVLEVRDQSVFRVYMPNVKKFAYWLVETKSSLDPRYVYSCPLVLNTMFNLPKTKELVINVSRMPSRQFIWHAELAKEHVNFGDTQHVLINIQKLGGSARLFVGYETFLKVFNLSAHDVGRTLQLEYKPVRKGEDRIYVFDDAGNAVVLTYDVGARGEAYIESVLMPTYVREDSNVSAIITVINKKKISGLVLEVNDRIFRLGNGYNNSVSAALSTKKAGKKYLRIRLLSNNGSILDEEFRQYEVIHPPVMELIGVSREKADGSMKATIELYSTDVCLNASLLDENNNLIGSMDKIYEGKNRIILNLRNDLRNLKLECLDLSGQKVAMSFDLNVSLIDRILWFLSSLIKSLNRLVDVVL